MKESQKMSNLTYAAYINNVSNDMIRYFMLTSSAIGIPCNIISIFIFARLLRNKTNMGFLYLCQCIVDLYLMVIFFLVIRAYPLLFSYSFLNVSDGLCKFLTYLKRFTLHISSWMPVLITFDRLIFVLHGQDQKFKFMKRKRYLSLIILGMFICLAIADIPNLFFELAATKIGNTNCSGSFGIVFSSDMISTFLRTYIPLLLMLWFNYIMIRKIVSNKRLTYKQSSLSRHEHQFTLAVMAYCVYFFVINSPLAVFYIFYDVNLYTGALTGDYGATYNLLNFVFVNLSFCQQPLSFFMNFATNKIFRQEIMMLIGKRFGLRRFSRVLPTQSLNTPPRTNPPRNGSLN